MRLQITYPSSTRNLDDLSALRSLAKLRAPRFNVIWPETGDRPIRRDSAAQIPQPRHEHPFGNALDPKSPQVPRRCYRTGRFAHQHSENDLALHRAGEFFHRRRVTAA